MIVLLECMSSQEVLQAEVLRVPGLSKNTPARGKGRRDHNGGGNEPSLAQVMVALRSALGRQSIGLSVA
jgi:hypothetical protein